MTTRVIVRPSAERDIDEAFTWYLENAFEHAPRFLDDLRDTLDGIRDSPRLSRLVYGDVRRAALRTFPYLVWFVYFEESDVIDILAVSHQQRDPNTIRDRLS
ncbi:MAG: type II toxin-antitoxin system RelE/ParE family toxin [Pseudolysinimonas sp.]